MSELPRQFEFDCKPFGKGSLYIANLDVKDRHGHVEIRYSPNKFSPSSCNSDEIFWVETEEVLSDLINKGYRRITEIYDKAIASPNIDDLI